MTLDEARNELEGVADRHPYPGHPARKAFDYSAWIRELAAADAVYQSLRVGEGDSAQREKTVHICPHSRVHSEGSLGWFCSTCGRPVDDLGVYCDV